MGFLSLTESEVIKLLENLYVFQKYFNRIAFLEIISPRIGELGKWKIKFHSSEGIQIQSFSSLQRLSYSFSEL